MRVSRIHVANFRNFRELDVALNNHAVIVGENRVGKSNLIYAIRLLLDSSLPDSARQLRIDDFWDGVRRPIPKDTEIKVAIEFTDFDEDPKALAILAEHLVAVEPMVARLTYVFRPLKTLSADPIREADFEFLIYGGDAEENIATYELRRRLPIELFPALRDAESDLVSWRRSPLRPLLEKAVAAVGSDALESIVQALSSSSSELAALPEISSLNDQVTRRLSEMVGSTNGFDATLRLAPTDAERLLRAIRLYTDAGRRGISEASLGAANLIYLALKTLELRQLVDEGNRDHTLLAIEEPEAHLHPHLQRLVYRDFLETRKQLNEGGKLGGKLELDPNRTIFMTTHSPHVVSVAPLRSLVVLRRASDGKSTEGYSAARIQLNQRDVDDLERYLDVSRGEVVFSRGILLVEGEAECYVLPALARALGFRLDEMGISICSVCGVNFEPYAKLFGSEGLNIPYAIISDNDPVEGKRSRGIRMVEHMLSMNLDGALDEGSRIDILQRGRENGIFLNEFTLEVDMFLSGCHVEMCDTLHDLTDNGAAKQRALRWKSEPELLDPKQFLEDIGAIGKGRFAQRLASGLSGSACPSYINDAIEYLKRKMTP